MADLNSIKAKLAKLLRMQKSSNANEAANAAAFVERLCQQHGLTPDDISPEYDPERDVAVSWDMYYMGQRLDWAKAMIVWGVADYFNGQAISSWTSVPDGRYTRQVRCMRVVATQGNKIQIELYSEYLIDTMNKLADAARAAQPWAPRSFKTNFRKGFASEMRQRLRDLKAAQCEQVRESSGREAALVRQNRNALERRASSDLFNKLFPKTNRINTNMGHGSGAGRAAAGTVGFNKQAMGARTMALPGR